MKHMWIQIECCIGFFECINIVIAMNIQKKKSKTIKMEEMAREINESMTTLLL